VKKHSFRTGLVAGALALALAGAACGSGPSTPADKQSGAVKPAEKVTLRLGYFPNVTHAAGVAGVEKGLFAEKLGPGVTLETKTFSAGPAAVEAIFSGAIDASYVGPNPAINAFTRSNGDAIRIVAGATSGGAFLVVKPAINAAADLKGKKVATPQLGNTQDVALRAWLTSQGLKTDQAGGGDVHITPQDNATTLDTFKQNQIAGAWAPEPWATRLVQEGGGKVLVDERSLWPGGRFATTELMVRTQLLKDHPDVVERLLEGHLAATEYVNREPADAQKTVNAAIAKITGKALPEAVIGAAWNNMVFSFDPLADTLRKEAGDAQAAGLLANTKLDGIFDLSILNQILARSGQAQVKG
jgi:NitT/TauT family transport system substrate-binding protein